MKNLIIKAALMTALGLEATLFTYATFSPADEEYLPDTQFMTREVLAYIPQPAIMPKVMTDDSLRTEAKTTLVDVLTNHYHHTPNRKKILIPIHMAIMNHESGFSPFAVSKTGAAGIYQFDVRTGSTMHMRVFAPERYFKKEPNGTYSWRANSSREHYAYAEELQDSVKAKLSRGDIQGLISMDQRFDRDASINAGVRNFQINASFIKNHNIPAKDALDIAMLAHNTGTKVLSNALATCKDIESVFLLLPGDESISLDVYSEAKIFYASVSNLRDRYSRGENPVINVFERYNKQYCMK